MVKQINYKTYGIENQYEKLNSPQYCDECKEMSETPIIQEVDSIYGTISEAEILCKHCESIVNFWGYGHFRKDEYGVWA